MLKIQTHYYRTKLTTEEVKDRLHKLIMVYDGKVGKPRPFEGKFISENVFIIKPRFDLSGNIYQFPLIEGKINSEKNYTTITITTRPPKWLKIISYLMPLELIVAAFFLFFHPRVIEMTSSPYWGFLALFFAFFTYWTASYRYDNYTYEDLNYLTYVLKLSRHYENPLKNN